MNALTRCKAHSRSAFCFSSAAAAAAMVCFRFNDMCFFFSVVLIRLGANYTFCICKMTWCLILCGAAGFFILWPNWFKRAAIDDTNSPFTCHNRNGWAWDLNEWNPFELNTDTYTIELIIRSTVPSKPYPAHFVLCFRSSFVAIGFSQPKYQHTTLKWNS